VVYVYIFSAGTNLYARKPRRPKACVPAPAILAQALARLPIDTVDLYGNLLRDHGVQAC